MLIGDSSDQLALPQLSAAALLTFPAERCGRTASLAYRNADNCATAAAAVSFTSAC